MNEIFRILLRPVALAFAVSAAVGGGAAAADRAEIAVIVKTSNSNFWQNVQKGARGAAKELTGYTLSFQGPASESAVADQVNLVENAVNRKAAGIVLAPSDPDALVPVIKKAWEARIPVVLIDSAVADAGKPYYQSYLATDNVRAGELCAKELIARIGTHGRIVVMSYVAGAGSEIGRVGGFRKTIAANSQLQIIDTFYSQSQMATALNQATDALTAHPDLKGLFAANEPTAIGVGRALAQAGKAGTVVTIGFDGNEDLQGFIRNGTLAAIAVQDSYRMGYLGVQTVVNVIDHKPVAKFLDTGVLIVTKQNIDTPQAKNVLY